MVFKKGIIYNRLRDVKGEWEVLAVRKVIYMMLIPSVLLFAEEKAVPLLNIVGEAVLVVVALLLLLFWVKNRNSASEEAQPKGKKAVTPKPTPVEKPHAENIAIAPETVPSKTPEADIEEKITIENQPFRLSGMLHILTNKISTPLKEHGHRLYYDIEKDVSRYIIGDNYYLEEVLEILFRHVIVLSTDSEVILHISKHKNEKLVFKVLNEKGHMPKSSYDAYKHATSSSPEEHLKAFAKAKKIVGAMHGTISVKSSKLFGTEYRVEIPFYPDRESRSNQQKLKQYLEGKQALFIAKTKEEMKRIQYIFETYGVRIVHMSSEEFEKKKPDLQKYDMAILRSSNLAPKQISYFKQVYQNNKTDLKIIIMHDMFESKEKIEMCKPIAHAELYNPTIIGDVEEILYQMFILESRAVRGISNMEVFDPRTFKIKGDRKVKQDDFSRYHGAHIAIAEDSKVDLRVLQNILKIDGVKLFCMENGKELLELLEKEVIDLVFTDINMPVMDGLTMTKKIRENKKWDKLPIISISSMAFEHEVKAMQLAGMNAAISKPIISEDVYQALDRFLFVNPKPKLRSKLLQKSQGYGYNPEVLDIESILQTTDPEKDFEEILLETLNIFKGSTESFAKMVYEGQHQSLKMFALSMIPLCKHIQAKELKKMFEELIDYLDQNNNKQYLMEYVILYQKNIQKLEDEIERYRHYIHEH
jgi:CheY-like chemotaxis protein